MVNQFTALGISAVVLIKFPDQRPAGPQFATAFNAVDLLGNYKDGFVLAQLDPRYLPALRQAGAEAFVIDANSNAYIANTSGMSAAARIAYIDKRKETAQADLLIASGGGGGSGGKGIA